MRIALIAHDEKKPDMVTFCRDQLAILKKHELFATGTTGALVKKETTLPVHCFKSGPLGGDQEIGARVARGEIDIIVFFRDPLTAQPHEPDVSALFRLSDVYQIPLASNPNTAKHVFRSLACDEQ